MSNTDDVKMEFFFFSIALPFKKDTLQSMYSERSTFALVKYYIASVKCITAKSKEKTDLDNFNQDFYDWLQQSVRCESLWSRVAIFLKYPICENFSLSTYKKSLCTKYYNNNNILHVTSDTNEILFAWY